MNVGKRDDQIVFADNVGTEVAIRDPALRPVGARQRGGEDNFRNLVHHVRVHTGGRRPHPTDCRGVRPGPAPELITQAVRNST